MHKEAGSPRRDPHRAEEGGSRAGSTKRLAASRGTARDTVGRVRPDRRYSRRNTARRCCGARPGTRRAGSGTRRGIEPGPLRLPLGSEPVLLEGLPPQLRPPGLLSHALHPLLLGVELQPGFSAGWAKGFTYDKEGQMRFPSLSPRCVSPANKHLLGVYPRGLEPLAFAMRGRLRAFRSVLACWRIRLTYASLGVFAASISLLSSTTFWSGCSTLRL